MLASATFRPLIESNTTALTAGIEPFTAVNGSPEIQLFILFLAASDTKVGRNGLWHLRPNLVEYVPPTYRELLAHGRTGEWVAA